MALLRLSNGDLYADNASINRLVAPLEIGRFNIDQAFLDEVQAMKGPINQKEAMRILKSLDQETEAKLEAGKFVHRRVGNLIAKPDGGYSMCLRFEGGSDETPVAEFSKETMQNYLTPHYLRVNNWHFLYAGTIVKGLQLTPELQGMVYIFPGEWMRLDPNVLNWPVFCKGPGTVALSCYDLPVEEHKFDLHPELKVMPEMCY